MVSNDVLEVSDGVIEVLDGVIPLPTIKLCVPESPQSLMICHKKCP